MTKFIDILRDIIFIIKKMKIGHILYRSLPIWNNYPFVFVLFWRGYLGATSGSSKYLLLTVFRGSNLLQGINLELIDYVQGKHLNLCIISYYLSVSSYSFV